MEPTAQQRDLFESIFTTPTYSAIQQLSPDDFQWFIWYIYHRDGLYRPVYVNGPHDGQVDIELLSTDPANPNRIGIVQCRTKQPDKRGGKNVGVNEMAAFIQRTASLRLSRRCFFTNADFAPEAYKIAREARINLYNRERIRDFVIDIIRREENVHRPPNVIIPLPIPVICFANNKGGVGKTTLTVNLADAFAHMGKSVLIIDADPQCNTTYWLTGGFEESVDVTLQGIIEKEHPIHSTIRFETKIPGIQLVPCHLKMKRSIEDMSFDTERRLAYSLRALSFSNPLIDIILIDTQPDLTRLTRAALIASNFVVFPLEFDKLSDIGVGEMIRFVAESEQMHTRSVHILGAVGTKVKETTRIAQKMQSEINKTGASFERVRRDIPQNDRFILGRVRHHVAFSDIIDLHVSIIKYRPNSEGATDIKQLAERINTRVNLVNHND